MWTLRLRDRSAGRQIEKQATKFSKLFCFCKGNVAKKWIFNGEHREFLGMHLVNLCLDNNSGEIIYSCDRRRSNEKFVFCTQYAPESNRWCSETASFPMVAKNAFLNCLKNILTFKKKSNFKSPQSFFTKKSFQTSDNVYKIT
jgi:hypothetical protein